MREILFRGKRVEEPIKISPYAPDGWVYGALIECDDGCFILPYDISGEMYIDGPYKFRANDVEARVMLAKVDTESIGQYTGQCDKNGTKIFEGDILLVSGVQKVVVSFEDGLFVVSHYAINLLKERTLESEVIGNIYDNPELLKGE